MTDQIKAHIGFILGIIATLYPNLKFSILGQIPTTLSYWEALFYLLKFAVTAIVAGILGKGGQDIYTSTIKPWWSKKRAAKKRKKDYKTNN